ncbi:hypothetical protein [Stappia sp.]|uniref:hypothetical protein n=1 Tax=Stappia sp. TaxID=1870903 RepID=UPI0032D8BC40
MTEIYDNVREDVAKMDAALARDGGIVRLAPAWVPRLFCTPGQRIRLHPDDHYAFGAGRGGINERWFASAVRADNGPGTTAHEGLSLVVGEDGTLLPFDAFVAHHKADLLGQTFWDAHRGWPMYSKFFDNQKPLPFHLHQTEEKAALVGKRGKPEAYYYPPEVNNHLGDQPIAFLGLRPGTTRDQLRDALLAFARGGDNRITDLAVAYRLKLGTGWDIPAGILHAPPSVCTYEPQVASDVFSMWESWSNNREVPEDLLWKDVPRDHHGDIDFLMSLLEWDDNVDPDFAARRFSPKLRTARSIEAGDEAGWAEYWVAYRSPAFSAKELRVAPGCAVTLREDDPHGAIVIGGRGRVGGLPVASATLIRFGALSEDELFVSAGAAGALEVVNESGTEPLVILRHYGPGNAELAADDPVRRL